MSDPETSLGTGRAAERGWRRLRPHRHVALLGGTGTLADCWLALRHLAGLQPLVRGPAIAAYERAFAERIGVRHAFSFSSGRVGFYALLGALGVGSGDEVLLQVPTHVVVPNAVRYTGAQPVYLDCCPDSYNLDLARAEARVTPRAKLLVVQHTFGVPADMDAVAAFTARHRLELVEDCVHALGARYDGRPLGSFGRAAFFSTEETKTISSTMGGMVVTDDPGLAARVRAFQARCAWPASTLVARYLIKFVLYHLLTEPHLHRYSRALYERLGRPQPIPGATSREEQRGVRPLGYAQRLSSAQAALALAQLARLESNLAHRRRVAEVYRAALAARGVPPLRVPAKAEPALVRYPLLVADRRAALERAAPHAVLGVWFTSVLEEALSPAHGLYERGSCPCAEAVAEHLVNLPTHPRVRPQDAEAIVQAVFGSAP